MTTRKVIQAAQAPKAVGPYSVAIQTDAYVFCSGQIGLDPGTSEIVSGGVEAETRQVLKNLSAVLSAAGLGLENVVKTTVFLRDMNDFAKMNSVYAEYFRQDPPARSTIAVAGLPKGAAVEIEAVAAR